MGTTTAVFPKHAWTESSAWAASAAGSFDGDEGEVRSAGDCGAGRGRRRRRTGRPRRRHACRVGAGVYEWTAARRVRGRGGREGGRRRDGGPAEESAGAIAA